MMAIYSIIGRSLLGPLIKELVHLRCDLVDLSVLTHSVLTHTHTHTHTHEVINSILVVSAFTSRDFRRKSRSLAADSLVNDNLKGGRSAHPFGVPST